MAKKTKKQELREKRDIKAQPHLEQYAPVWLVDEKVIEHDDAVQFNVVFQHPIHKWVNRRYRYDAFDDVLYQRGQTAISEEEALELTEEKPYVTRTVADTPNAYGG